MTTVSNVRMQYRSEYCYLNITDIHIENTAPLLDAMSAAEGLEKHEWFFGLEIKPWEIGITCADERYVVGGCTVHGNGIKLDIVLKSDPDASAETELLQMEDFWHDGSYKRYLLQYGDDNEVYEFGEYDDPDEFEAINARSLEEAEQVLCSKILETRNSDPNYYGEGVVDGNDEDE